MSPSKLLLIQLPILLYICNSNFIYGSSRNQNLYPIATSLKSEFSQLDHDLAKNKGLVVVKGLDLTKYVGYWYQIAAIPTFFEPKKAINVRANYTMNSDGTVHVKNEEIAYGIKLTIEGTLYKADPSNDEAKFKVKFNVVPFPGNYWVLYVDDDYQYALVGDPTRFSLFVSVLSFSSLLSYFIRLESLYKNQIIFVTIYIVLLVG